MNKKHIFNWGIVFILLASFCLGPAQATEAGALQGTVQVETIIDSASLFPSCVSGAWISAGDLTADGVPDIAVTKGWEGCMAGAAVIQHQSGSWDSGTVLTGPGDHNAWANVVAPIKNDGQNWLLYTQHRAGNSGSWVRAHRYTGTTLVETAEISSWQGWPGWMATSVADLNNDSKLEIWYEELVGSTMVLHRQEWNPASNSFSGVVIASQAPGGEPMRRPESGDFLGDGSSSLIWISTYKVHLVTYTPGLGTYDHTSNVIFTAPNVIFGIASGEVDGNPGKDAVVTVVNPSGSASNVYLISGGSFNVTQIGNEIAGWLETVRIADLDGSGTGEVYVASRTGHIYKYESPLGWEVIATHPGVYWIDSLAVHWPWETNEEVLFSGSVNGSRLRIISLSTINIPPVNQPPVANAGGPYSGSESGSVVLNASGSSDPDNNISTYQWDLDSDGEFDDAAGITTEITYNDNGVYTVGLKVTDEYGEFDTDITEVLIDNVAPSPEAGPDQTVYRNEPFTVTGTWTDLAGVLDNPFTWSWDLDGDGVPDSNGTASYGDVTNETAAFAQEGVYTLTFKVADKDGGEGLDSVDIEVLNVPPACSSATPSVDLLWPPNHSFVPVEIQGLSDPEGDSISVTILSIFQDELVDSTGDGSFVPDGQGVGTSIAEVRAERDGGGNGRVYHIGFSANDGHGGSCTGEVLVGVPKSQGKKGAPVDDGPLYDSTVAPTGWTVNANLQTGQWYHIAFVYDGGAPTKDQQLKIYSQLRAELSLKPSLKHVRSPSRFGTAPV